MLYGSMWNRAKTTVILWNNDFSTFFEREDNIEDKNSDAITAPHTIIKGFSISGCFIN
jgi:hypothetical protein